MVDPSTPQLASRDEKTAISKGKVYLIGAGPGDPGLLTLRGLECLQKADIVLYDGLVNPAILDHVRPGTNLLCVGKHGQSRVWTQPEINSAIVQYASQGKCVARLKGGDPAIFARTAEELDRLVEEGISFEVVPGITAAMAAASYAGIPITHRDWASSVAFITGQSQAIDGGGEAEESMDWRALAQFPGTLVFYMGVTSAGAWSQHLIDAGKSPTTPAALVRRCSLPNQEIIHCTLGELSQKIAERPNFRPPVITIVGTVASLGPTFDWFTRRPLFGKTVLITRPENQSQELKREFEELGANVLIQPAIEIEAPESFEALDQAIGRLASYDWLVFTSSNGVRFLMERLRELGQDARALSGLKLACVGPSTSQVLTEYFLHADCVPERDYRAESLVDAMRGRVEGSRCLWVRGSRGRDVMATGLKELGATVDSVVAYRSVDRKSPDVEVRKHLEQGLVDFTIVTSGSIAGSLTQLFGDLLSRTRLISLSGLTSEALRELGHEVFAEARTASMSDIVSAIVSQDHD